MTPERSDARWRIVDLPTATDERGSLSIVETGGQVDFVIHRARWIYGVPPTARRGGHGHHRNAQLFVAVAGTVGVVVDDGLGAESSRQRFTLSSPSRGLLIRELVWIDTESFSSDAVLLMLGSEPHHASDYIRDYGEFVAVARGSGSGRSATT